jgi:hypothetical protein
MSAEIFPKPFGLGVYSIRIGLGNPPLSQNMVIDIGSDVTWFECKPCNCDQTLGRLVFDPLNSSSFFMVPSDDAACNHFGCNNNQCQYEVDYLDGSFTKSYPIVKTLTFGRTTVLNVFTGCGHLNQFIVPGINGLMGLGGGPLSLPSQLRLRGLADTFSYCLPPVLIFGSPGWLNFSLPGAVLPAKTAWIPLLRNSKMQTFYSVELSGLGIGDMRLPIPPNSFTTTKKGFGGVIIDSGTTYTLLPTPIYEVFRNAYVAKTINLPRLSFVSSLFDTCYNLSGLESVQVPNVSFFFSAGSILTLKRMNILVKEEYVFGDQSIFCLAFVPVNDTKFIIGNTQLAGIQTTFDPAAGYMGFGPSTCGTPENSPHCHGHWPARSIALENSPNPLLLVCFLLVNKYMRLTKLVIK